MADLSARHVHANELFAPLPPTYERYGALLSFGQDPRWRRFLVSRIEARPDETVLDVATGTGAVARELLRRYGCRVVGLDQSREMVAEARRRLPDSVRLVEGDAERLPFGDGEFDALTVTYLLRYVDDVGGTLRELARVVRSGARIASLEFAVPEHPVSYALWRLYVDVWLPLAGRLISPAWGIVGSFLGPSIRAFWRDYPLERQLELWREAEIEDVRSRRLSLGGGIVVWGRKA